MTTSINQKYLKRAFFDKVERANSYAYKSQVFVGEPSDFIVIIKDSIHKNDGKQPTPTAGKYICYGKGQIFDDIIENGIVYKEGSFFHIQSLHKKIKYSCDQCDYQAMSQSNLKTHIQSVHEQIKYSLHDRPRSM